MTKNKNYNGYFAIVLNDSWVDTVSRNATMEVVRSDHITIAYKPDDETFSNISPVNLPVNADNAITGSNANS